MFFFYFFACLLVLFCLFFIYCNVCNFVSFYRISFPLLHPAFCTTRQAASTIFIGVQTFTSISALSLHQIPLCVYVSSFISPLELMKLDKWKVHCRGRIQSFWNVNLSTFSQSRIHLLICFMMTIPTELYIMILYLSLHCQCFQILNFVYILMFCDDFPVSGIIISFTFSSLSVFSYNKFCLELLSIHESWCHLKNFRNHMVTYLNSLQITLIDAVTLLASTELPMSSCYVGWCPGAK